MRDPNKRRKRKLKESSSVPPRDSSRSKKARNDSPSSHSEDSSTDLLEQTTSSRNMHSDNREEDSIINSLQHTISSSNFYYDNNGENGDDYENVYRFVEVAESDDAEDATRSNRLNSDNNGENEHHENVGNEYDYEMLDNDQFDVTDHDDGLYYLLNDNLKKYEASFDPMETDLINKFFSEMYFHSSVTTEDSTGFVNEDNSSPFVGEDDEVLEKFQSFMSDVTSDDGDGTARLLRFRNEPNEITVVLSIDDFRDLDSRKPFWVTARMMDTFLYLRLRLFPNEIQQRVHRCSADMIGLNIHNIDNGKNAAHFGILEKAVEKQMKEADFNIIPLLYSNHWTLAIVCGLGNQRDAELPGLPYKTPCVLHFNSIENAGITKYHTYAIAKAVAQKAGIESNAVAWYEIKSPQQPNGEDCGFYVMRFAVEFLKNINSTHPKPVDVLFHSLEGSLSYPEGVDKEPITKVPKKLRLQLKGFIASINRDERDWINQLPECIPKKIKEMDASGCQVQMLNKVQFVHVSLDHVMSDT